MMIVILFFSPGQVQVGQYGYGSHTQEIGRQDGQDGQEGRLRTKCFSPARDWPTSRSGAGPRSGRIAKPAGWYFCLFLFRSDLFIFVIFT